jgi:predicted RNA binding protein YcfA (HicA-like mRNA interferase family)
MPRLRSLTGQDVLTILIDLGFEVVRIRGSHHHLTMKLDSNSCFVTVPVHRRKPVPPGTLTSIYRQAAPCVSDIVLRERFYTE